MPPLPPILGQTQSWGESFLTPTEGTPVGNRILGTDIRGVGVPTGGFIRWAASGNPGGSAFPACCLTAQMSVTPVCLSLAPIK